MYFEIDVHCVICGGPFSYHEKWGWSSIRMRRGACTWASDHDGDDAREGKVYDPAILQENDIRWLGRSRLLSGEAKGPAKRVFISRRGKVGDYGNFKISTPEHRHRVEIQPDEGIRSLVLAVDFLLTGRGVLDENDDGNLDCECFYHEERHDVLAFPHHESCWDVLNRFVLATPGSRALDKNCIFMTMRDIYEENDWVPWLRMDYGRREMANWECIPGDEFLVCDPAPDTDIVQDVVKVLQQAEIKPPLNLAEKVSNDPFARLPYDITLEMMSHLPHQSWLNWLTASYRVYEESRQLAFWQRMFRIDILPWFPEIEPLFLEYEQSASDNAVQASMDIKRLYLYVQHATDPVAGRPGPLMGIANRRRIIKACQAFVDPYMKYLNKPNDPASVS